MHSAEKHLLESITQELRLPEIDADVCVHTLCNDSDCHACVDACPAQAWILDDETLGLDACGNAFHIPLKNSQPDDGHCRICRHHNHSSNLYQVLD